MAGTAVTAALINQMAAQDADWLGQTYAQIKRRLIQWSVNCPDTATMTEDSKLQTPSPLDPGHTT